MYGGFSSNKAFEIPEHQGAIINHSPTLLQKRSLILEVAFSGGYTFMKKNIQNIQVSEYKEEILSDKKL